MGLAGRRPKYTTVSIPSSLADAIDRLVEELGYWPSRGAFVREACLEKLRRERRRMRMLREAGGGEMAGEEPSHMRRGGAQ